MAIGGSVERVVVPLERREARQAAEPLARARRGRRRRRRASRSRASRMRATRAPSAFASSWPPRQWPITGTPSRDRVAQQRAQRRDPRQRVVDAHRPAHHADAGKAGRARGHGRALVERDSSHGMPCASSHAPKRPGVSVGEKRKMATGRMAAAIDIKPRTGATGAILAAGRRSVYICLNRCVNCREIGSFSWPVLEQDELPLGVLAQHARHRVEVHDRAAMHLPELVRDRARPADPSAACGSAPRHCASTTRVYLVSRLEVDDVGHGDQLHLLADRRLDPLHAAARRLHRAAQLRDQRGQVGRRRWRACAACARPSARAGRSRPASAGSRRRPPRTPASAYWS